MATAKVKFIGYAYIEVPDDMSDEEAYEYIENRLEDMDGSNFEGEAEFDDWW